MKQDEGLQEENLNRLKGSIDDIVWMAIRYAHGRHTMAPHAVRTAVKNIKEVFPDFELIKDKTLKDNDGSGIEGDFLHDLYTP